MKINCIIIFIIVNRYIKQRKINDAIHLLHNGAKSLLNYDQEGSAFDLFKRLINIYNSESVIVTEESVGNYQILILNKMWNDDVHVALKTLWLIILLIYIIISIY